MKNDKTLFDKMLETFNSEIEDSFKINIYETAGEGTWNGWTYMHLLSRVEIETIRKVLMEVAEVCFGEAHDELDDILKEKKEEIVESSKEIDVLIEKIRELTENEEITDLLNAIDQVTEEMEESLKELNF